MAYVSSLPSFLYLLDGFELRIGVRRVALPRPTQRLLALLATRERPLRRAYVASLLWPDVTKKRAMADLRSALRGCDRALVVKSKENLELASGIAVDYRKSLAAAHRVQTGACDLTTLDATIDLLSRDLLPDWPDEWVEGCRQSHHQLRLHALETLAEQLVEADLGVRAERASLVAVEAEPLRESSHRLLIRALLIGGNHAQAVQQYEALRWLLHKELSVEPSFRLDDLHEVRR